MSNDPRMFLAGVLVAVAFLFAPALMASGAVQVDWTRRLEALTPADPLAYFLLAEEIADGARSEQDKELARHLFALSASLAPERLGRSACIALADLADDEQQQRRLTALASLLIPSGGSPSDLGDASAPRWLDPEESEILALGEALSFYRRGVGTRSAARINRGDAAALLQAVEQVLPSGTARNMISTSPAPRSRPTFNRAQIEQMLQLEAALLAGRERTWSADLVLTRSNPLIELDPSRVDEALGIDATRARYQNGRWVE